MIKNYQLLKETIHHVIQNSGLDVGAAYFILKDVYNDIEKTYYGQLNKECLEEINKQGENSIEEVSQNETT